MLPCSCPALSASQGAACWLPQGLAAQQPAPVPGPVRRGDALPAGDGVLPDGESPTPWPSSPCPTLLGGGPGLSAEPGTPHPHPLDLTCPPKWGPGGSAPLPPRGGLGEEGGGPRSETAAVRAGILLHPRGGGLPHLPVLLPVTEVFLRGTPAHLGGSRPLRRVHGLARTLLSGPPPHTHTRLSRLPTGRRPPQTWAPPPSSFWTPGVASQGFPRMPGPSLELSGVSRSSAGQGVARGHSGHRLWVPPRLSVTARVACLPPTS